MLKNSSDFDIVQIAGQNIENNPYSEMMAAMISHKEIYIDKTDKNKIVKSNNRLANIIDKRDLVMQASQLFEARGKKIQEIMRQHSNGLLPRAINETQEEQLTNRILAEHIADHEMTYGKGNITTEKFTAMHDIAKHEASLEVAMRQEWCKREAKQNAQDKTKSKPVIKVSAKNLSKKLPTSDSDIETSVAVARHRMRQEMNDLAYSRTHEHRSHIQQMNPHMDPYQNSLHEIAQNHHGYIHDHIAQVKNAQVQLEQSNREQRQELQRYAYHNNRNKGMDINL